MNKTLVGTPDPQDDPYATYREQYRATMRRIRNAMENARRLR